MDHLLLLLLHVSCTCCCCRMNWSRICCVICVSCSELLCRCLLLCCERVGRIDELLLMSASCLTAIESDTGVCGTGEYGLDNAAAVVAAAAVRASSAELFSCLNRSSCFSSSITLFFNSFFSLFRLLQPLDQLGRGRLVPLNVCGGGEPLGNVAEYGGGCSPVSSSALPLLYTYWRTTMGDEATGLLPNEHGWP